MIEPPAPGFTGVVWEARPTDRLARELTSGPGSVHLVEAATAWTGLAASFGAAVADYDRIIAGIRAHWRSETSDQVVERLSTMRDWLVDTAAAAGRNAQHTAALATAYEVARLAMPHTADIAALEQTLRMIQAVGASLGGALVGVAAEIDSDQDAAKATAARVMRTYEAATEPLARPWQQSAPPPLATAEALEAEQAAAGPRTTSVRLSSSVPAGMPVLPQFAVPRTLSGARVHTVGQVVTRPEVVPTVAATAPSATGVGQALPPAALAGAGSAAQGEEEHTPRAGAADSTAGAGPELEAGLAAAPSVLGGVETTRPAGAPPEQGRA
ncbi:PPE family protein [Nocardia higoensis]|uniref:PPE family protein n=1 Tax=Nocardia higoensis TaxID=228599 RepID=UPI0002DE2EFB|nr:PPE family protein [Nocardia higoensis]